LLRGSARSAGSDRQPTSNANQVGKVKSFPMGSKLKKRQVCGAEFYFPTSTSVELGRFEPESRGMSAAPWHSGSHFSSNTGIWAMRRDYAVGFIRVVENFHTEGFSVGRHTNNDMSIQALDFD